MIFINLFYQVQQNKVIIKLKIQNNKIFIRHQWIILLIQFKLFTKKLKYSTINIIIIIIRIIKILYSNFIKKKNTGLNYYIYAYFKKLI